MRSLGVKGRRGVTSLVLGLLATPAVAQYAPQTPAYPAMQPGYQYPQAQPQTQQPTAPPAVSQTQVGQPGYQRYQQAAPVAPPTATIPTATYPATQPSYPYVAQQPSYTQQQSYPQQQVYPQQQSYPTTTVPVPGSNPQQSAYPRTAMQPRYALQDDLVVPPVPQPAEPIPAPVNGPNGQGELVVPPQHANGHVPGMAPHHAGDAPGGYQGSYVGAGDCNCDMQGWNTYMQPYAHGQACAEGGVAACNVAPSRQWFLGVYSLYMQRDRPSYDRFAVRADMPSYPYHPMPERTVLDSGDINPDFTWGAEIRFGSTFGRSCDSGHGCAPCTPQRPYAWEVVYWGLTDDDQSAMVSTMPDADVRLMGTINYDGLEYDRDGVGGGGWAYRPINEYHDYYNDPMLDTNDVRVLGIRVRNSFKAQNLELNFLKLPLYGCDPCSPITVSTVCGVRYMKFDEDFQNAIMFTTVDGGGMPMPGEPTDYTGFGDQSWNLYHDIEVDNQLVGFQLGANMNWAIACKWDVFCDSMMGVYNNRIDVYQRVYGGGDGEVRFIEDGRAASVRANKDDIAFMGELRWGLGYQVSCNCRLTAAYRLMAITGVALANEQMPTDWSNWEHVAWVDSNDSLILHGLQLGAEFKF